MVEDARNIAIRTATRLADLIHEDGEFSYVHDPNNRSKVYTGAYNIVRHAGSLWALNQASYTFKDGSALRSAVQRALMWLLRNHLSASPQSGCCLVERGKIKLGATALAILAIVSSSKETLCVRASLYDSRSDLVEKLCDHILGQVTADGNFVHKRDLQSGEADVFRSEYYTGEALFALLSALLHNPTLQRLRVAQQLFYTLAERNYGVAQQSHWMMYAAEIAYMLFQDPSIVVYAERIVKQIATDSDYRLRRMCTPIACRSEALLAYLRMLHCTRYSGSRYQALARREVLTNLSLQLNDMLPDGAFCRGAGDTTVRIDYLQHNLLAFLGYARLASL